MEENVSPSLEYTLARDIPPTGKSQVSFLLFLCFSPLKSLKGPKSQVLVTIPNPTKRKTESLCAPDVHHEETQAPPEHKHPIHGNRELSKEETRDSIIQDGVCIFISEEGDYLKPKRALTAYNFFFQEQRRLMLQEETSGKENGVALVDKNRNCQPDSPTCSPKKIGFSVMAKEVSARWKAIDKAEKEYYSKLAEKDMVRYTREISVWRMLEKELKKKKNRKKRKPSRASSDKESGSNKKTAKKQQGSKKNESEDTLQPFLPLSNGDETHPLEHQHQSSSTNLHPLSPSSFGGHHRSPSQASMTDTSATSSSSSSSWDQTLPFGWSTTASPSCSGLVSSGTTSNAMTTMLDNSSMTLQCSMVSPFMMRSTNRTSVPLSSVLNATHAAAVSLAEILDKALEIPHEPTESLTHGNLDGGFISAPYLEDTPVVELPDLSLHLDSLNEHQQCPDSLVDHQEEEALEPEEIVSSQDMDLVDFSCFRNDPNSSSELCKQMAVLFQQDADKNPGQLLNQREQPGDHPPVLGISDDPGVATMFLDLFTSSPGGETKDSRPPKEEKIP